MPTPLGASRLVPAMSALSVKTRHALSRHCGHARVYGHTTTFRHDMSTPPARPLLPRRCQLQAREICPSAKTTNLATPDLVREGGFAASKATLSSSLHNYPLCYILVELASVGDDTVPHANTRQSLQKPDNQGTVSFVLFSLWRSPWLAVELDHMCAGWRTLIPPKGNGRITQCDSVDMARRPRGSYIVHPLLSLEVATPETPPQLIRRCHSYARNYTQGSAVRLTSGSQ